MRSVLVQARELLRIGVPSSAHQIEHRAHETESTPRCSANSASASACVETSTPVRRWYWANTKPIRNDGGLDGAALFVGKPAPILIEAFAQRDAVEQARTQQVHEFGGLIEEALIFRGFERRQAGFGQMHVRVLQTWRAGRQLAPKARDWPAHVRLDIVERCVA